MVALETLLSWEAKNDATEYIGVHRRSGVGTLKLNVLTKAKQQGLATILHGVSPPYVKIAQYAISGKDTRPVMGYSGALNGWSGSPQNSSQSKKDRLE